MLDYLGNEINVGDTVIFAANGIKDYKASFQEEVVKRMTKKKIEVTHAYYGDRTYRKSSNVINLTALGLRPRLEM